MQPTTVYCDTCGAANRPQARFCMSCGQAMPAASSPLPSTVQAALGISSAAPTVLAGSSPSASSLTGLLPAHSLLKQRYLILSRLGQGGMGAVYKAADTQLGDRLVAVKEMGQKGLDPQEVTQATAAFKREAHLLAGLPHHPHLPSMYDHFEDSGRWYLVMDFIAGETLAEYVDKAGGKLPPGEVLDIGLQLTTVLNALHSHRPPIIFRDLKPANVMRTPEGNLFLIDFGIARHFKVGQAKDTIAYGSAGYASPEQYGKAQTTPQSDIYSLGATLHHLLSGQDPSQSPFIFPELTDAAIPTELGRLIARMVAMDAGKRPASMAEVQQELQRLQRLATQPQASQLAPTQSVGGPSLPPTQIARPMPLPPQPALKTPPPQPQPVVQRRSYSSTTKATVRLGTIGAAGHGKTTLTAAISKILQASKAVVPVDHIEYETNKRHYTHIDNPASADDIKNIIAGAAEIDGAILVVSVPDGPMPQTREQILDAGMPAMVVFLNKVDLMDDEDLEELVELEVREILSKYQYRGDTIPVIRGSALKALRSKGDLSRTDPAAACIWKLMDAVDNSIPTPQPAKDKPFLMAVEDVFGIKGRGTVVTGRIERGRVKVGEQVEIIGMKKTRTTVVTGVEMFQKTLDQGEAGDNVGCLLRGVERTDIERGQVLAKPGSIRPYKTFKTHVYVLSKEEGGSRTPFFTGYRSQFYIRTTDVAGTIRLPAGVEMVTPGEHSEMTVELTQPVAMEKGVRFAIRENGRTIGAGICTSITG